MEKLNITLVLPSFNPDERLIPIIQELVENGFDDIILVNDGSEEQYMKYFPEQGSIPQVTMLSHSENRGKGAAMKTAFRYFLENRKESAGVVTIDGDGQHLTPDIIRISQEVIDHPDAMTLGVRDFNKSGIPPRSVFGNKLTCFIFRTGIGLKISDTQTGLRGIPAGILPRFIETKGDRFEYETNQLLDLKKYDIPLNEVEITTVYEPGNRTSHFRPIIDSVKIYANILKFGSSSLISWLVDIVVYTILVKLLPESLRHNSIWICSVGARVVSSIVNFSFTRKMVFNHKGNIPKTMAKYYLLVVCMLLCSAGLINLFSVVLHIPPKSTSVIKLVVDFVLFFCSYTIQRKWVFSEDDKS